MSKEDKEKKEKNSATSDINKDINEFRKLKNEDKEENELLEFFLGMVLLGAGLFMLSKRVIVTSGWYTWRIGSISLSSGTVTIPLLIGIIWYFFDSKSIIPKLILTLSVIFLVLSIIMSVSIRFIATSMFDYILILGMAAAGSGLLLKVLFKKRI